MLEKTLAASGDSSSVKKGLRIMPTNDSSHVRPFDLADFAQEFLRRNPDYRAQYDKVIVAPDEAAEASASIEMAKSWGLEFPDTT